MQMQMQLPNASNLLSDQAGKESPNRTYWITWRPSVAQSIIAFLRVLLVHLLANKQMVSQQFAVIPPVVLAALILN
jgi:hypothetical protein